MVTAKHAVPLPNLSKRGASGAIAADMLNQLIAEHDAQGWAFSHLEEVTVWVPPGCVGALFGAQSERFTYQVAIFEAEIRR